MEGLTVRKVNKHIEEDDLNVLLAKQGDNEIMLQDIPKDAIAWLTPVENPL